MKIKLEHITEKVKESVLREKPKFTIPEKLFEPLNNVEYDLLEAKKNLVSKGPSFCPMPFNVNWPKATEAFADWENQVRRKLIEVKKEEEKEEMEKYLVHLRHLAKIHPAYIEDTRHFNERMEQINEKYAPLPPTTLLKISWDTENFYPSCDTEKVIEAARKRLEERVSKFPPTEC